MGFDLKSTSGAEFEFRNSGWRYLLAFARSHGFEWPRDENGEDEEALSAAQAAALADAIERGISRGQPSEVAQRVSRELTLNLVTSSNSAMFREDPLHFNVEMIEYWKAFIAFARAGGFSLTF